MIPKQVKPNLLAISHLFLGAVMAILVGVSMGWALEDPAEMKDVVGIKPHISNQVDLALEFTDSSGQKGRLSNFMAANTPTIIVPVYYECPRLCGLLTDGIFTALKGVSLVMGRDYKLLFVSIDPREGAELAAKRKNSYLERINKDVSTPITSTDFNFLVGQDDPVRTLMSSLGFHYRPDGERDFAHTAAIMILTPEGKIAHYFLGIEFEPQDLRLAIVEASDGQVGSFVDRVLLYCFRFDPTKGKYTWAALNVMKAGGVITLLALGSLFGVLWRRERAQQPG